MSDTIVNQMKNLIKNNKIKEVLDLIDLNRHKFDLDSYEINQLQSRYNRLQSDIRLGLISKEQESLEYSRIVHSIYQLIDVDIESERQVRMKNNYSNPKKTTSEFLIELLKSYKEKSLFVKKHAKVIKEGEELLKEAIDYEVNKKLLEAYDMTGDKLHDIRTRVNTFTSKIQSLESEVKQNSCDVYLEIISLDKIDEDTPEENIKRFEKAESILVEKGWEPTRTYLNNMKSYKHIKSENNMFAIRDILFNVGKEYFNY